MISTCHLVESCPIRPLHPFHPPFQTATYPLSPHVHQWKHLTNGVRERLRVSRIKSWITQTIPLILKRRTCVDHSCVFQVWWDYPFQIQFLEDRDIIFNTLSFQLEVSLLVLFYIKKNRKYICLSPHSISALMIETFTFYMKWFTAICSVATSKSMKYF